MSTRKLPPQNPFPNPDRPTVGEEPFHISLVELAPHEELEMQIALCETHIVHLEPDDTVLSFGQRDISESTSAPVSLKSLPRVASD